MTSFFDHHYPNYGTDNEITIYTGESVADCSPHCYEGHPGYDWSMVTGTPVLAAAGGVVRVRIDSTTGYGRRLVIDHENGYYTLYAHLNSFNAALNQRVAVGDVIAWSGSTGTPAAHLHFGVYRGPVTAGAPDDKQRTSAQSHGIIARLFIPDHR
jgi:murein DD-endopeptidase MepM/ murein hydrolase activator NlpD